MRKEKNTNTIYSFPWPSFSRFSAKREEKRGRVTWLRTRVRTRHNAAQPTKRNSARRIILEEDPFSRLSRYSEDRQKGFPAYRSVHCERCVPWWKEEEENEEKEEEEEDGEEEEERDREKEKETSTGRSSRDLREGLCSCFLS